MHPSVIDSKPTELGRGDVAGGPRKILCVIDTLEIGGAERSLLAILRRVDRRRFEPLVCQVYSGSKLRPSFEAAGIRTAALEIPEKYHLAKAVRRLCRLIQEEKPALIHTSLYRSDQVGRIAGCLTKTAVVSSFVSVSYGTVRLRDNPHLSAWKLRVLQLVDLCTARLVHRFHAVSESVKAANCRHLWVRPDRVVVVPRGRDVRRFPCNMRTYRQISSTDASTILLVGRLTDAKGHRYLLEAMPRIRDAFPRVRVQFAGAGWMEGTLRELVAELDLTDSVHFLGEREDIPELLHDADLFVLPSLFEGFPGALVEAMLAGCPIVASDLPTIRELIDDGVDGALMPPMDCESIAHAVIGLLKDTKRRRTLGKEARRKACRRFDIDRIAHGMQQFYEQVLG